MRKYLLFFAKIVKVFFESLFDIIRYLIEKRETILILLVVTFIYPSAIYLSCSRENELCTFKDRGSEAFAKNHYDSAILFYNISELIEAKDSSSLCDLFYSRSLVYQQLGDTLAATSDFLKALQEDSTVIYRLAYPFERSYSANGLNNDEILDFAVDHFKDWYLPYFKRGQYRLYSGEPLIAVSDFKKALFVDSTKVDIYSWLIAAYRDLNNQVELIRYCSLMIKHSTNNEKYLAMRGRARILIGDSINGAIDLLKSRDSFLDSTEKKIVSRVLPD
jgi:tetratricopeptide (TPR) repeat protein